MDFYYSFLPAAAQIIHSFVTSLQHLILQIDISLARTAPDLTAVDLSPLAVLGATIPRIDLYVHTDTLSSVVTLDRLMSFLAGYDDIMRSIKEDRLVIHSEETAPEYIEGRF